MVSMTRIELMRNDPIVRRGNVVTEVKGRQRELFRLLVLRDGRTVDRLSIAELRDSDVGSIASKIRYLRNDLTHGLDGHALIVSDPGNGYRVDLTNCSVDAKDFRSTIERITGNSFRPLQQPMDPEVALDEVKQLQAALDLWEANPAAGLPSQLGLEGTFDSLKVSAEERLAVSRLYTKDREHIRKAISQLRFQARKGEADVLTWTLLLLAQHALGLATQVSATTADIRQHFEGKVPPELQRTMSEVNTHDTFENPFREALLGTPGRGLGDDHTPEHTGDALATISTLCELLGITTASRLRLVDTNLTPAACIRRTQFRLNFSGVLASKWVMEPGVRSDFDKLLTRLDENGGEARFLMINPKGDGYRRLSDLRNNQISLESVPPLERLAAAHPSLQVRAFNNLPSFRIVIIDDDVVSFSPYRLAADAYASTERGWEAPHIVLDPIAKYPLSEAFQMLFDETWKGAVPLEEV